MKRILAYVAIGALLGVGGSSWLVPGIIVWDFTPRAGVPGCENAVQKALGIYVGTQAVVALISAAVFTVAALLVGRALKQRRELKALKAAHADTQPPKTGVSS